MKQRRRRATEIDRARVDRLCKQEKLVAWRARTTLSRMQDRLRILQNAARTFIKYRDWIQRKAGWVYKEGEIEKVIEHPLKKGENPATAPPRRTVVSAVERKYVDASDADTTPFLVPGQLPFRVWTQEPAQSRHKVIRRMDSARLDRMKNGMGDPPWAIDSRSVKKDGEANTRISTTQDIILRKTVGQSVTVTFDSDRDVT